MGGKTGRQRLEARRRTLQDQVFVYALTSRRPPRDLVEAFLGARAEAESASREPDAAVQQRYGLLDRLFSHSAAG
ncbi:MAG TPA: hypothetical protein VL460_05820 [Caulobacteraceae bacterium]|jgi:hypothetical protein|nr:hypothetical protein [Caulobacteraceae bacterium]